MFSDSTYQLAAMLIPGLARDYAKRQAADADCLLSMAQIFTSSAAGLRQKAMAPKLVERVIALQSQFDQCVEKLLKSVEKNQLQFVSIESPEYPEKLKSIADPPLGLFIKGDLRLLSQRQLAMVGSRNATRQALNITQSWARKIAQHGITVTSGMALGIDAAAHAGALEAGLNSDKYGKTIAVLGCGLAHVYPKQHWRLWQKIVDAGGVIVSEYLPETSAKAQYFPQRNRIISGMSEGVVVIEAALKSGSLITARLANEQGREVFALPGSIWNSNASGCHSLIQQGAKLVTKVEEIFEEYVWGDQVLAEKSALLAQATSSVVIDRQCRGVQQEELGEKENKIVLQLLNNMDTEVSIDDIVLDSGLAFAEVCSILLHLEINGAIKKTPNGYQKVV